MHCLMTVLMVSLPTLSIYCVVMMMAAGKEDNIDRKGMIAQGVGAMSVLGLSLGLQG